MQAYIFATYSTAIPQFIAVIVLAVLGAAFCRRFGLFKYSGLVLLAWIAIEGFGLRRYGAIGSLDAQSLSGAAVNAAQDAGWFFAVWLAVFLSRKLHLPNWAAILLPLLVAVFEPVPVAIVLYKTVASGYGTDYD